MKEWLKFSKRWLTLYLKAIGYSYFSSIFKYCLLIWPSVISHLCKTVVVLYQKHQFEVMIPVPNLVIVLCSVHRRRVQSLWSLVFSKKNKWFKKNYMSRAASKSLTWMIFYDVEPFSCFDPNSCIYSICKLCS